MRHLRLTVYALAAIFAAQLVLHNHALTPEHMAPPCSVCVFGADRPAAAPVVSAPLAVAYDLPVFEAVAADTSIARHDSSRAPPRS